MTRRARAWAILFSLLLPMLAQAPAMWAGEAEPSASEAASGLVITDVAAIDVTPTSAAITWTVSRPATGQVEYGTSEAYGSSSRLEASFDYATHVQQLEGLEPDTLYHFRVHSTTANGRSISSAGDTFRTPPLVSLAPWTPTDVPTGYGPRPAPEIPAEAITVPADIDATGGTDVSATLQSWVDSVPDGSVLLFPEGAVYQLERGIYLDGDRDLAFHGYGARLQMTGCGSDQSESGFHIEDSRGIRILGFEIVGTNDAAATYAAYDAGCGEQSMGVALYGDTRRIEVADVSIRDVHGDAIYTNCSVANPDAGSYHFHHNLLERTGRQMITVNQGRDIRIEHNVLRSPALYSVDSEDCRSTDAVLTDLVVEDNWFDTWNWHYSPDGQGPGEDHYSCRAIANTYREGQIGEIERITIRGNHFTGGCGGWGSANAGLCDPSNATISMPRSALKVEVDVLDNVFDVPVEQRCGLAIELENVRGGEVSGNSMPGQRARCAGCDEVQEDD